MSAFAQAVPKPATQAQVNAGTGQGYVTPPTLAGWTGAAAGGGNTNDPVGVYNVKSYGAMGTGVGNTAADSAGIAAAILAWTNAGWGVLLFPPGDYYDTNTHVFRIPTRYSGHENQIVAIQGYTMGASNWKFAGTNTTGNFLTFSQHWPDMSDLTIRGPGMAAGLLTGARGSHTNGGSQIKMSRVAFIGWGAYGAQLEGTFAGAVTDCDFEYNFIGLGLPTYTDGFDVTATAIRNVVGIAQNSDETSYASNYYSGRNMRIYAGGNYNRYGVIVTEPCEVSGYWEGNTNATVAIGWDTNYFDGTLNGGVWTNLWREIAGDYGHNIKVHNLGALAGIAPAAVQFYAPAASVYLENVRFSGTISATQTVVRFNYGVESNTTWSAKSIANPGTGTSVVYSDATTSTATDFTMRHKSAIGTTRTGTDAAMLQVVRSGINGETLPAWTLTLAGSEFANTQHDTLLGFWGYGNSLAATGTTATPLTGIYSWSGSGFEEMHIAGGYPSGKNYTTGRLYAGDGTTVGAGTQAFYWTATSVGSVLNHVFTAGAIMPTGPGLSVGTASAAQAGQVRIQAIDNQYGATITGGATSGSSLGLNIIAGSTSADYAFRVQDKGGANLFYIKGNGDMAGLPVEFCIAAGDETTAISTGTGKVTFRAPYAFTLTQVRASVNTAPTGSTILIDVTETGTTVLSTKLMIDATEKTSTTAATPYVISDAAIADDAEISIDFDQVGSTIAGAGVKVWLKGTR